MTEDKPAPPPCSPAFRGSGAPPVLVPKAPYDPRSVYGAAAGINPSAVAKSKGAVTDDPIEEQRPQLKVQFGAVDIRLFDKPDKASAVTDDPIEEQRPPLPPRVFRTSRL